MKVIHIICCNGGIVYAVIEDLKRCQEKVEELKLKATHPGFWTIVTIEGE